MCRSNDEEQREAEHDIVFATFQPGRLRKWSREEMRRLPTTEVRELLASHRAVVLAEFESSDGARFGP